MECLKIFKHDEDRAGFFLENMIDGTISRDIEFNDHIVQQRLPAHEILYAILRERLMFNLQFQKCADVIRQVPENCQCHSDIPVYDSPVRLARD
jgi:hypothetical protein